MGDAEAWAVPLHTRVPSVSTRSATGEKVERKREREREREGRKREMTGGREEDTPRYSIVGVTFSWTMYLTLILPPYKLYGLCGDTTSIGCGPCTQVLGKGGGQLGACALPLSLATDDLTGEGAEVTVDMTRHGEPSAVLQVRERGRRRGITY